MWRKSGEKNKGTKKKRVRCSLAFMVALPLFLNFHFSVSITWTHTNNKRANAGFAMQYIVENKHQKEGKTGGWGYGKRVSDDRQSAIHVVLCPGCVSVGEKQLADACVKRVLGS